MIRSITSLVFVTSMLLTIPCYADNAADAKEAFSRGRTFFMQGKYKEALGELQRAYSLRPHPSLLRYMGDTFYKLNKAHKAIEHYKKYLQAAPEAADKEKVQNKVRQLEMIVGAAEEEEEEEETKPQPIAPAAPTAPVAAEPPGTAPVDAPTGEDREDPIALQQREAAAAVQRTTEPEGPSNTFTVLKWVSLGVGLAMLGAGVGLNRAAASDADALVEMAKSACPPNNPECGGNPRSEQPQGVL